jgi:hypothetical protein
MSGRSLRPSMARKRTWKPKYPAYMYRDWPEHSPALIANVDAWALVLSPAWTPEKARRRWVWRKAFQLHHDILARSPALRSMMPWSPLVPPPAGQP